MEGVTEELLSAFEMIIVHMCTKSVQPFAGMPMAVGLLSDDFKRTWHVRFAYGSYFADGRFVPCG